jgi:hypothetical protein
MRRAHLFLVASLAFGCGSSNQDECCTGDAGDSGPDAVDSIGVVDASDANEVNDTSTSDSADAPLDSALPPCDFAATTPPPGGSGILWGSFLDAKGVDTLGGHGHDDGKGPVGFCKGAPTAGKPFFELVAAGMEVDYDLDADGSAGDDPLLPNFFRDPKTFTGKGESGGRVAIYVDIIDEAGKVLDVSSAPQIRLVRTILDGPVEQFPLTSKPAAEFQTNLPMVGGGQRYGIGVTETTGAESDRVINMRLPNNHHVTYELVFRRKGA